MCSGVSALAQAIVLDSAKVVARKWEEIPSVKRKYTPEQAANTISVFGEPDVLRHISSFPGVSQGLEGTMGLFVRGGDTGGNRVLFDGVPIYSSSHLFGMLASIPAELADEVDFYPGGIPSCFGNASSSVTVITPKRPLESKSETFTALSPYLAGISLSRKTSETFGFQCSARTSLVPIAAHFGLPLFTDDIAFDGSLYDAAAKLEWSPDRVNSVDVMLYSTRDSYSFIGPYSVYSKDWSEHAIKAGWAHAITDAVSMDSKIYALTFNSGQGQSSSYGLNNLFSSLSIRNRRYELCAQSCAEDLGREMTTRLGIDYRLLVFSPSAATIVYEASESGDNSRREVFYSNLLSLIWDWEHFGETLHIRAGIRPGLCFTGASGALFDCDGHFSAGLSVNDWLRLDIAADRLVQYSHTLEGLPTGWAIDTHIPANPVFPQESSNQVYLGASCDHAFTKTRLTGTAGLYIRHMDNLVSYKKATNVFYQYNTAWEQSACTGEGISRGVELSASWTGVRHGIDCSYTLSKTDRTYPEINAGNPFPFKYDRRHILNLESSFDVTSRQKAVVSVEYASGNLETLPVSVYEGETPPYWNPGQIGYSFSKDFYDNMYSRLEMSPRNGFRLPDYFRLDLSYTFKFHKKKSDSELTFSVYNVTNRHNPCAVFIERGEWKTLSLLPIMPSVRWTLKI